MQRCSEAIGALAGALAKAQAELTNPAKSLTATIPALFPREADRTFRYASLSAGLEIVRKCLGQHEIAVVQTTGIEHEAGLIRLTTVLAHSSGEWMSSDWPVCPVAEMGAPHRMGAALTYARRYALFTLVGIAGEDDLDAPDLPTLIPREGEPHLNGRSSNGREGLSVQATVGIDTERHRRKASAPTVKPVLAPEVSVERRDELLLEIAALDSDDRIDAWALRALPAKNNLQAADAQLIEDAFGKKLTELVPLSERRSEDSGAQTPLQSKAISQSSVGAGAPALTAAQALGLQHYAVTPKPRRLRDKRHREFVASQPCVVCGRQPSDAHHLRFTQPRALGRKVSDEFTVPLCRTHHREVHRAGKEPQWWAKLDIEPLAMADKFWAQTHPLPAGPGSGRPDTATSIFGSDTVAATEPRDDRGETNPIAD